MKSWSKTTLEFNSHSWYFLYQWYNEEIAISRIKILKIRSKELPFQFFPVLFRVLQFLFLKVVFSGDARVSALHFFNWSWYFHVFMLLFYWWQTLCHIQEAHVHSVLHNQSEFGVQNVTSPSVTILVRSWLDVDYVRKVSSNEGSESHFSACLMTSTRIHWTSFFFVKVTDPILTMLANMKSTVCSLQENLALQWFSMKSEVFLEWSDHWITTLEHGVRESAHLLEDDGFDLGLRRRCKHHISTVRHQRTELFPSQNENTSRQDEQHSDLGSVLLWKGHFKKSIYHQIKILRKKVLLNSDAEMPTSGGQKE